MNQIYDLKINIKITINKISTLFQGLSLIN